MDFHLSDEQRTLSDTLARFFAERLPLERRLALASTAPGYSVEAWRQLAELGALGALFPEALGGYGGSAADILAVFEPLGAAAAAGPFLPSLICGRLLGATSSDRGGQLLEAIIAGETVVTLAHQEPRSRYDLAHVATRADRVGDGWSLSGAKAVAPWGDAADHFIISARSAGEAADEVGLTLFLVPAGAPGLRLRGYLGIDGSRWAELSLDGMKVHDNQRLGDTGEAFSLLEAAVSAGVLAICADALGALGVVRDSTVEYLRTRVQFGQPIGAFQALQHRMATLLVEIEQARSAVINAVAAFDEDRRGRERAVAAAKYTVGRVATLVAEEAVQLHGGIGMTWELPLSHSVKRLMMLDHLFGDVDHHLERYIQLGRAA